MRITDLTIPQLQPGYHWDDRTPGFGIWVGQRRKTWVIIRQPNRTKVKLGYYPAIGLSEARQLAYRALGTPTVAKKLPSFPDALTEFLAQGRWRPKPRIVIEQSLRKHFRWEKAIDKITHQDVLAAIEAVPTQGARSHALKDIRTFFNWTVPRYLPSSPAAGIKMPTYVPRARILSEDELKRVWIAAEQIGYPFGTIVQLLILTGQRRGEIAALQTSWITENAITLPKELTKNGREHTFPLCHLARTILDLASNSPTASMPRGDRMLFPAKGQSARPFSGWSKSKAALDKASGVTDWTLHDLRRTFATGLASLDVPIHVTEKLLNHVSGTTGGLVGVYQKFQYWDAQVAAVNAWENRLQEIVG